MLYLSDFNQLLASWQQRIASAQPNSDYFIALQECVSDLQRLLDRSMEEALSYEEYLSQEADYYISCEEDYYATAI